MAQSKNVSEAGEWLFRKQCTCHRPRQILTLDTKMDESHDRFSQHDGPYIHYAAVIRPQTLLFIPPWSGFVRAGIAHTDNNRPSVIAPFAQHPSSPKSQLQRKGRGPFFMCFHRNVKFLGYTCVLSHGYSKLLYYFTLYNTLCFQTTSVTKRLQCSSPL